MGKLYTVSKRSDRSLVDWAKQRREEDDAEERQREQIGRKLQAAIAGDRRRREAKEALRALEEAERRERENRGF